MFSGNYSLVFVVYDNFKCLVCCCILLMFFDKCFWNLFCKYVFSEGEKKLGELLELFFKFLVYFG